MTVWTAIYRACYGKCEGDTLSLSQLADETSYQHGRTVLEATVERYLRWWERGEGPRRGPTVRSVSVRKGVRRITEIAGETESAGGSTPPPGARGEGKQTAHDTISAAPKSSLGPPGAAVMGECVTPALPPDGGKCHAVALSPTEGGLF